MVDSQYPTMNSSAIQILLSISQHETLSQWRLAEVQDKTAVKSDDLLRQEAMEQAIDGYLRQLTAREAGVLRMRYGLGGFERPHTLEEIGFRYAVTRERIRQIEMKAFGWLKRSSFSTALLEYTQEEDEPAARTGSSVFKKSE